MRLSGIWPNCSHALRDFQLRDRIFANRCSFLIYSESFRALPEILKARVLDRLQTALRNRDPKDRYAYLGADEKERIYGILAETHPDVKARWNADRSGGAASAP